MPWICPRCQLVHSDFSMECNCPVPTGTATGSVNAVPQKEVINIPSCWPVPIEKPLEGKLTTTAWPYSHTEVHIYKLSDRIKELENQLRSVLQELQNICGSLTTHSSVTVTNVKKVKKCKR